MTRKDTYPTKEKVLTTYERKIKIENFFTQMLRSHFQALSISYLSNN